MGVLVGSVVAPHTADDLAWLEHAEQMQDGSVDFFLAMELDGRGERPFEAQLARLAAVGGSYWTFHLDKTPGEPYEVRSEERFIRIATGRNLVIARALDLGVSHILFLDADARPPGNVLPQLLAVESAMGAPVVFGHLPSYCLDGERIRHPDMDVRLHGDSLGCVLVARKVFRRVGFGWAPDDELSDDPRFWRDTAAIGCPPVTRHDCVVEHAPLIPLEARGTDRYLRTIAYGPS
jgi:hypothetical protein